MVWEVPTIVKSALLEALTAATLSSQIATTYLVLDGFWRLITVTKSKYLLGFKPATQGSSLKV